MGVTLHEILAAREQRVAKQKVLLQQYKKPIVCFTMNIAGPEKSNDLIRWGFELGNKWLLAQLSDLKVVHTELYTADTGCEGYYVVDTSPAELKYRTIMVEDSAPVARLFDMDVLDTDGSKLERTALDFPVRKCLLCDHPAHICSRSRTHSVEALQAETTRLLSEAITQEDCAHIAETAQKSLLFEVCTTPKPGLVDRRNNGSHRDMDIFTFMASAAALAPYFARCAEIGAKNRHLNPTEVFSLLRLPGKLAEQAMYQATGGTNTHKGCIFSLGILCAAAGQLAPQKRLPENILQLCRDMTRGLVEKELSCVNSTTVGESLYAQYGITGVRGQAEAGFPAVLEVGLPTLKKGLQKGLSLNEAGCATLLALLVSTDDTNLIHRSSLQEQKEITAQIADLLQQDPYPSEELLQRLDDNFMQRNLSPGGSADLLALTYFLHFLGTDKPLEM